ncbi:MAG: hypothetical protein ACOVSR_12005 [Bacteroidia bacterium]|jgi:hypothetical protein
MKISIKIFIGITILLLLITVFAIVNTKVSMKYEVDEPTAMNRVTELVTQKAKDIKSLLFLLLTFFIYEIATLSLLIWVLTKLKNTP